MGAPRSAWNDSPLAREAKIRRLLMMEASGHTTGRSSICLLSQIGASVVSIERGARPGNRCILPSDRGSIFPLRKASV